MKLSTRAAVLVGFCIVLQGCELFNKNNVHKPAKVINSDEYALCVTAEQNETFGDFCSLERWLEFVINTTDVMWPQRKEQILSMSDDARSLLIKILLSQPTDTPYNQRLRAQNWVVKIEGQTSPAMNVLLDQLIYQTSQQLLEFESAITILSRVNVRQQKAITELEQQLSKREQEIQKQQEQVDKLLKIETDLIEQNRSEKR